MSAVAGDFFNFGNGIVLLLLKVCWDRGRKSEIARRKCTKPFYID